MISYKLPLFKPFTTATLLLLHVIYFLAANEGVVDAFMYASVCLFNIEYNISYTR